MAPTGFVVGLALERRVLERAAARRGLAPPLVAVAPPTPTPTAGRAADAARALIARGAGRVMSFGLAAGLHPGLSAGAAVVADGVLRGGARPIRLDADWAAALGRLPGVRVGPLATVGRPLLSSADKRAVAGLAADMESWEVARAAAEAGIPAAALRVVVDPAHRSVPAAALAGLGPDGQIRSAALAAALIRRPADILALVALAVDMAAARRSLDRLAGPALAIPPPDG